MSSSSQDLDSPITIDQIRTLIQLKRYTEAREYIERLSFQNPNLLPKLHYLTALSYYLQKETQKALNQINKIDPNLSDLDSLILLSRIQIELNQIQEAICNINSAISQDPGNPQTWALKGEILIQSKNFSGAESAFRKALQLDPDYLEASLCLIKLLLKSGKYPLAKDIQHFLIFQEPDDADIHKVSGFLALIEHRLDDAKEHFLEALKNNPNSPTLHRGLEEVLLSQRPLSQFRYRYENLICHHRWGIIIGLFSSLILLKVFFNLFPEIEDTYSPLIILIYVSLILGLIFLSSILSYIAQIEIFLHPETRPLLQERKKHFFFSPIIAFTLFLGFSGFTIFWSPSWENQLLMFFLFVFTLLSTLIAKR